MKRKISIFAIWILTLILAACGRGVQDTTSGTNAVKTEEDTGEVKDASDTETAADVGAEEGTEGTVSDNALQMEELSGKLTVQIPEEEDLYRTTYEVFVYSFYDGDGDGIGDLPGLTQKLDYINDGDPDAGEDLGCTEIWTMPVFPSPTYHKYDVTDYMSIDPEYGTMEDFEAFLSACHERGIRLILDLAINHTSTEHPWFLEACGYLRDLPAGEEPDSSDCRYFSYYNWQKEPGQGYAKLDGTDWYYECRFWEGMPDLNLDNEEVREELKNIAAFWLDKGVDGFRLDAVTSYYTGMHEQNTAFLRWFNDTVKEIRPDCYLVGEAWENQNIYARYYESGMDSLFDFGFAGQDGLIANVVRGSRPASAYAEALVSEEALYAEKNPDYVNAPFYTNHDMARSTGYYAYDDGSRTKLAGALNILMPGNAFIYYGEELGMKGSGKDENKRAPMQWTDAETGASGMCTGPEGMDSFSMKFAPLDEQQEDPLSVWNYYRTAIRIRNSFPAISHGQTRILEDITGEKLCTIVREIPSDMEISSQESTAPVCVIINTSEEEQTADLSGTEFADGSLAAVLTVSEQPVLFEDSKVTLPPFGIAVIR